MSLLTPKEGQDAARTIQDMVAAHGEVATRLTPPSLPGPFGDSGGPFTVAGQFPVERVQTPQVVLDRNEADAIFSTSPSVVLLEGDRLEVAGVRYTVLSVAPVNLFGVLTHQMVSAALVQGVGP